MESGVISFARLARLLFAVTFLTLIAAVPQLWAAGDDDFDSYKVKITGVWFYANPTGNFQGANDTGTVNLQKDIGFNTYSTFTGKFDWKISHKNHLYFVASPFSESRQTVLTRTISFQGQTFVVGLTTQTNLKAHLYAPGYQYDFIRRKRGHLGIGAQLDLFDSSASLKATAQVVNGTPQAAVSASGSLLAPIPVLGPEFRYYLTNSPRVYVQGNVYGMYFFGYGNFVSTADTLGIRAAKHLNFNVGYQLGSRLVVNNNSSSNRIGFRSTQKGAIVGIEFPL